MLSVKCIVCNKVFLRKEMIFTCSKECENVFSQEKKRIKKMNQVKDKKRAIAFAMRNLINKRNALLRARSPADSFYGSEKWLKLRYYALNHYGRKCMCCHATDLELHVDHIKPRSLFPELQWELDNLQILCRQCNLGKSNDDFTDYRPK